MSTLIACKIQVQVTPGANDDEVVFRVDDTEHTYAVSFDKKGVLKPDGGDLPNGKDVTFTRTHGSAKKTGYTVQVRSIKDVPPLP